MKRFFSPSERKTLYLLSKGMCNLCKKKLGDIWHADHVIPYSKGGETTISNGQALCPQCNNKKNNSMKLKKFTPRDWQRRCFTKFFALMKSVFAIGAVPGAGKSKMAAWIMSRLLKTGDIDLIFAISPQEGKKREWKQDFLQFFGINLTTKYSSGHVFKSKYNGAVLTYSGINEKLFEDIQRLCKTHKVGVIADEPHHLSESEFSKWGHYFEQAFAQAKYKVFLSGTYWREDGQKIPFIPYDEAENKYNIDFIYSYTQSLLEGNSRKVEFDFCNPIINFQDTASGIEYKGKLSDVIEQLDETVLNRIYAKIVKEKNRELYDMISKAIQKLNEIRINDMPNAAMIIFAPDIETAESLQAWLNTEDFGYEQSVVVHSKDENSNNLLDRFKKSDERIIISVNKVSEGVDINRLRVGVFFSIYKTFLYFIQSIVGRQIRVTQEEYHDFNCDPPKLLDNKYSYAFLLHHPKLKKFSEMVESDIQEAELRKKIEPKPKGICSRCGKRPCICDKEPVIDFSQLTIDSMGDWVKVTGGETVDSDILSEVEKLFDGVNIDPNDKSRITRRFAKLLKEKEESRGGYTEFEEPPIDMEALEKEYHDTIDSNVKSIAARIIVHLELDFTGNFGPIKAAINNHLKNKFNTFFNHKKSDVSMDVLNNAANYTQDIKEQVESGNFQIIKSLGV